MKKQRTNRRIKKLKKILEKVKKYKEQVRLLSDEELAGLTAKFKKSLENGKTLDQILPKAFAAICEADRRVLGMDPYDSQILGGIALHKGYLAQMNTGEGKTLVATMPLYLNALTGKSTILLTTNGYLALRDGKEMGPVYKFMGLTVGIGVQEDSDQELDYRDKQIIYNSDIVYTTNGALGFDYLIHNLVKNGEDRFLRDFYYVIIDEADQVLLDDATMPLIISGSPRVQSNLYAVTDLFVQSLKEDEGFEKDEGQVWFTEEGIKMAEDFFKVNNLYSRDSFEINRHLALALRARTLFEKDKNYVVNAKGEVLLLDGGSGRAMPGVKLRGGQNQAIEAKEHVKVSQETRAMASVTYQNLFLMFPKMAGMSGTILDVKDEMKSIYGIDVLAIPPNKPVQRIDLSDRCYRTKEEQLDAAVYEIITTHRKGQPVLSIVADIKDTETISQMLLKEKIPHNVLNANNAAWEASMIKEAGRKGAVTVATSMAGRGTDIKLGPGVKELGGLAVIGVGRMSNIRQERQARGRAGRQGDPGESRFFISLDDEIAEKGIEKKKLEKYKKKASGHKIKKMVNRAQALAEEQAAGSRKGAYEYDFVLQQQRDIIYNMRDRLLDGKSVSIDTILKTAERVVKDFFDTDYDIDAVMINRFVMDNITYNIKEPSENLPDFKRKTVSEYLMRQVFTEIKRQEEVFDNLDDFKTFSRVAMLQAIDDAWVEQVDYLQQLQSAVSGRSTAQRNPVYEYQVEAQESFRKMEKTIYREMTRNILMSSVSMDENHQLRMLLP